MQKFLDNYCIESVDANEQTLYYKITLASDSSKPLDIITRGMSVDQYIKIACYKNRILVTSSPYGHSTFYHLSEDGKTTRLNEWHRSILFCMPQHGYIFRKPIGPCFSEKLTLYCELVSQVSDLICNPPSDGLTDMSVTLSIDTLNNFEPHSCQDFFKIGDSAIVGVHKDFFVRWQLITEAAINKLINKPTNKFTRLIKDHQRFNVYSWIKCFEMKNGLIMIVFKSDRYDNNVSINDINISTIKTYGVPNNGLSMFVDNV